MTAQPGSGGQGSPPSIAIRGPRVLLRALQPDEIDAEWHAMTTADPMTVGMMPDEASFRDRLSRSGQLRGGWLDLAIDLGGQSVGRIQTFVPTGRPVSPGVFNVGIGLREHARGLGYGREALALLTDWLFVCAQAQVVEAPTDPANTAMRTVFERSGWRLVGTVHELGRQWVLYGITRQQWGAAGSRG